MGTRSLFHPRRILLAPDAISVHGGVSRSEPRTRALRFRAEGLSDLPNTGPAEKLKQAIKTRVSIVYLQLKIDEIQNDYLIQTLVFLAGVEMRKTPA